MRPMVETDRFTEKSGHLSTATRPKLVYCSIIVPVYEEEENIPLLHERITKAMEGVEASYEVVYVDDGSRDGSYPRLLEVSKSDPRVVVVQFRRNFGQTAALAAGIDNSNGEIVVFMDADLQNDPADIPRLLEKLEEGYDVVSGWRVNRQGCPRYPASSPQRSLTGLSPGPQECICMITGVLSKRTAARSSSMSTSTGRCTASSLRTPPG